VSVTQKSAPTASGLDQVTLSVGDKSVDLPVQHPVLGAPCIDIEKPMEALRIAHSFDP